MKKLFIKCFAIIAVMGFITACSSETGDEGGIQESSSIVESDVNGSRGASKFKSDDREKDENVNLYEEYKDYPIYSKEFIYYLLNSDIFNFPDFSGYIEKMEADLESAETEEMYVYKSGFGGDEGFKHAPDKTEYIYIGQVKDGEPHGVGKVVCTFSSNNWTLSEMLKDVPIKVYEGYFDKGRCDGFGISYAMVLNDNNIGYIMEEIVRNYNSEFDKYLHLYYTPIDYLGEYDKGEKKGFGALFFYPEDERGDYILGKYSLRDMIVKTGELKKNDLINGREYQFEHLVYDGDYNKGMPDGQGNLYYPDSDALAFEGTFKKGEVAKGTLYLPDGSIVQEGEWKNGICGITDFNEIYNENSTLPDSDRRRILSKKYDMDIEDIEHMEEFYDMLEEGELAKEWESEIKEERDREYEEYILPDSNRRYLTEADLEGMDDSQLRLARNEIYARHGRSFQTPDLNNYFNSKSWYDGYIPQENFDDSVLNEFEKANLELIKSKEGKDNASEENTVLVSGLYEGDIDGNIVQISISLYSEFIEEDGMKNLGDFEIIVDNEHEWANILYNNSDELIIMDMYGNVLGSAVINGKDTLAVKLLDTDILFTRIERY